MPYKTFENNNFPKLEKEIAEFWSKEKIFEKSVEMKQDQTDEEFLKNASSLLQFKAIVQKDCDVIHELYSNKNVRQFYYHLEHQFPSKEQVANEIAQYESNAQHGIKRYILLSKDGGGFIGTAGFAFHEPTNPKSEVELSYLIDEKHWGKGYGFDAISSLISLAFDFLNLPKIVACTTDDNIKSQNILKQFNFQLALQSYRSPKASKTKNFNQYYYTLENVNFKKDFIFYDGPPFANGLPHYGHLLTSFIKDIYARYQTMNGKKTQRRFGWDCHGLPAEMEVEKQLGIQGRVDITKYGIGEFNEQCRESVMKYAADWEDYIEKAGRWVDFKNDYKTMDTPYMESVIWAFKKLHEKGLIYEDFRVMPYSWKAETPLSNFETRMDNAYREKASKAVTVKFTLTSGGYAGAKLLVWTTTPWTLPSNLMIAVGKEIEYVAMSNGNETVIIAKNLVHKYAKDLAEYKPTWICDEASDIASKIIKGNDDEDFKHCAKIRKEVFIDEQSVPQELESDGLDSTAHHVMVFKNSTPIATARILFEEEAAIIQRICVLKEYRNTGVAKYLMCEVLNFIAQSKDTKEIKLSSQKYIEKFYAQFGFVSYGETYLDAGMEHINMQVAVQNLAFPSFKGEELINSAYHPLFPYFKNHKQAFKIVHADFVTTEDGTGSVHIAPGFGEDDHELCKKLGIKTVCPVDEKGKFTDEIFDFEQSGENKLQYVPRGTLIATEKLTTREITQEDFDVIKKLYQNAEVRKHYSKQILTDDEIHAEINLYITLKEKFGYSRLMVFEQSTGKFVGLTGIDNVTTSSEERQIGFTLHKEFWGKGYATEIAKVLIAHYGVNEISAYSGEENVQSHSVLKKLGFVLKGKKVYERSGVERQWFVLDTGILSLRGRQVFDCNDDIIKHLKKQNAWLKTEQYIHNYPHCWRTDTPLIYKALPSWYVKVTDFKDEMVANNQNINWVPNHVQNGIFGKWLENARDWSISRNRFWGCPVPVWKSNNPDNKKLYVFGSIKELEEFFGVEVKDLHRPFIDTLIKSDPLNPQYQIKRVEDVLDCWFESGSMPFASEHFPFNGERFKQNPDSFTAKPNSYLPTPSNFPADFIVEYTAQTRGWFYTLMVLGTALFGKEPFKNCICHGVILDENGQKLSKRLRNYPDPLEVFETIGSDAMRYFTVSSPVVVGGDLFIPKSSQGIAEILRLVIKPIWNSYNFFAMYANADGVVGEKSYDSKNMMDVYILSKLHTFLVSFKHEMDSYNTQTSCKLIEEFIDSLNNWYIRRNKERFWKSEKDEDKAAAYNTLYTVILDFTTAIAPILPFTSEAIFQRLQVQQ